MNYPIGTGKHEDSYRGVEGTNFLYRGAKGTDLRTEAEKTLVFV